MNPYVSYSLLTTLERNMRDAFEASMWTNEELKDIARYGVTKDGKLSYFTTRSGHEEFFSYDSQGNLSFWNPSNDSSLEFPNLTITIKEKK